VYHARTKSDMTLSLASKAACVTEATNEPVRCSPASCTQERSYLAIYTCFAQSTLRIDCSLLEVLHSSICWLVCGSRITFEACMMSFRLLSVYFALILTPIIQLRSLLCLLIRTMSLPSFSFTHLFMGIADSFLFCTRFVVQGVSTPLFSAFIRAAPFVLESVDFSISHCVVRCSVALLLYFLR